MKRILSATFLATILLLCLAEGSFASAIPAGLILTEIMYNPGSTPDNDWEYVEIYNASTTDTVDLTGYVFADDETGALLSANIAGGTVGPLSTAILFDADNNTLSAMEACWGTGINFVAVTNFPLMANDGDRIGLWASLADYDDGNFANAIFDVQYHDLAPWPMDNGQSSIFLTSLSADPTLGDSWALSYVGDPSGGYESNEAGGYTNVGSPGGVVPEPATVALMALGALGTLLLKRKRR